MKQFLIIIFLSLGLTANTNAGEVANNIEKLKASRTCEGCNLQGADLRGLKLLRARLNGANLSTANLIGVQLGLADLSGANLSGADLSEADLHHANLSGADLSNAYLEFTNLEYSNLIGADLSGADLYYANLENADFSEANLGTAMIEFTDLSKAVLCNTNTPLGINDSGCQKTRNQNLPNKTSFPAAGLAGMLRAKMSEIIAIADPAKKTSDGEYSQTSPKATGIKTAAI